MSNPTTFERLREIVEIGSMMSWPEAFVAVACLSLFGFIFWITTRD